MKSSAILELFRLLGNIVFSLGLPRCCCAGPSKQDLGTFSIWLQAAAGIAAVRPVLQLCWSSRDFLFSGSWTAWICPAVSGLVCLPLLVDGCNLCGWRRRQKRYKVCGWCNVGQTPAERGVRDVMLILCAIVGGVFGCSSHCTKLGGGDA